jgi:hypothetical protein
MPDHQAREPMPELSIRAATAEWTENTDGVWTWHPQASETSIYEPFQDGALLQRHGAIHEAGHAVAALVVGIGVDSTELAPSNQGHMFHTVLTGTYARWSDYATMLAAGERAADRWLREIGAWTPERAWSIERGARSDRAKAVESAAKDGQEFSFLSHPWDGWTQVCSRADGRLGGHWPRVIALADALIADGSLDASSIATITGLPNPSAKEANR